MDDCAKFVAREKRRGNTYDGIIMDPPSYGRGPGGEIWKLEDCIYDLISQCEAVSYTHLDVYKRQVYYILSLMSVNGPADSVLLAAFCHYPENYITLMEYYDPAEHGMEAYTRK